MTDKTNFLEHHSNTFQKIIYADHIPVFTEDSVIDNFESKLPIVILRQNKNHIYKLNKIITTHTIELT